MLAACVEALARVGGFDGALVLRADGKQEFHWKRGDADPRDRLWLTHDWSELFGCGQTVSRDLSDSEVGSVSVLWTPIEAKAQRVWVGFIRHGDERPVTDYDFVERAASALHDTPLISEEIAAARYESESLNAAVALAGLALWNYSFESRMFRFDSFIREWFVGAGRPGLVGYAEVYDAVDPQDRPTFQANFEQMPQEADSTIVFVVRVRHPQLGMRWVRFIGSAGLSRPEAPESARWLAGTAQDVHEQVCLDDRILRAVSDLADARVKTAEVAQEIQSNLLVKAPPKRVGDFYIRSCSFPSQVADGDFFDVLPLGDGIVDLVVGDVMGKGIEAALVGASLKAQVARTLGLLAVSGTRPETTAVMQAVHDCVGGRLANLESFATMAYVRLDAEAQTVELVDCGHTRTLVLSPKAGTYRFLSSRNLPLGIIPGEVYSSVKEGLTPGDVVFLYSDGLLDAIVDEERMHEEGVAKFALAACTGPYPADSIIEAIRELRQAQTVRDDLTCLAVEFRGAGSRRFVKATFDSDPDSIDGLREFIGSALAQLGSGADEREQAALEIVAVEAFTNIIRHAHKGRADQVVKVDLSRELDVHVLRLRYAGERFEQMTKPMPDIQEWEQESGWGLPLIGALASSVEYDQDDRGVMSVTISRPINFQCS